MSELDSPDLSSNSDANSDLQDEERQSDDNQQSGGAKNTTTVNHDIFESEADEEIEQQDTNDEVRANDETQATIDELFGDAADVSSEEEEDLNPDKEDLSADVDQTVSPQLRANDDEEPTGVLVNGDAQPDEPAADEEAPPEVTRIPIAIPFIQPDLGSEQHFVKLPNFLSVDTRPFDPSLYEDEADEDSVLDEEGRTRLKLKVENTVRWRVARDELQNELYDANGDPVRESNARIVRWSDNTLSLYLGSEIFDVHTMPLTGDYNHLFIRQGNGLLGQSVFRTKLAFRPHSTDSFTHRKMTLSMAERSSKAQKIRVLPIAGADPEQQINSLMKQEEERVRADVRRESTRRRLREKQLARGKFSSSFLEDDGGANTISLSAIKKKYKTDPNRPSIYSSGSSSDLSSSGDEVASPPKASVRPAIAKRPSASADDADSDLDSPAPKRKARAKVVSDDDDSD